MDKAVAVSMRVPQELVDRIDAAIEEYGHHTTRPDFIVDGMRSLLSGLLQFRLLVMEALRKNSDEIEMAMITVQNSFKLSFEDRLSEFENYGGEQVQVMVRIPAGLEKDIMSFNDSFKPYRNRMEFMRLAIIHELDHLENDRMLLNSPSEAFIRRQNLVKRTVEDMRELSKSGDYAYIIRGLSNNIESRLKRTPPSS